MTDCIINLRNEPRLRDNFQYTHVHNNTALIDRRTKWGNPYRIGEHGDREAVIALYRSWLWNAIRAGKVDLRELADLDGMWLACWCDPLPCHGQVLARAARWAAERLSNPS